MVAIGLDSVRTAFLGWWALATFRELAGSQGYVDVGVEAV